jgi:tetratricopeptide (TPR) repeat protein
MYQQDKPELHSLWAEARQYIESGSHEKAVEIYKYILVRYADDATAVEYANSYLGDLFLTLRNLDLAEKHLKKAINITPENPGYRYILGFIYSHKRQWNRAISEFEIAVNMDPDNAEYLRGLGWAVNQRGDTARGIALLEKASRLAPANADILTDLAVAYLSAVDINKASEYAERAVRMNPTNTVAQDVMKKVLSFSQGFSQLNMAVTKTRKKPSNYADAHYIHRFKVSLRDKPDIWRIIDIKGNQMLSSLHKAIFKAFDRFEEHQYSFFLNNKPYDMESAYHSQGQDADETRKLATRIRIDSIALYGGPKFLYLFDYGDEWWHEVDLLGITPRVTRASYPKVVLKQGKSPPQYPKH